MDLVCHIFIWTWLPAHPLQVTSTTNDVNACRLRQAVNLRVHTHGETICLYQKKTNHSLHSFVISLSGSFLFWRWDKVPNPSGFIITKHSSAFDILSCWGKSHSPNLPQWTTFLCHTSLFALISVFLCRSCTDVVCCVIFVIVILGYIALGTVGEFDTLSLISSDEVSQSHINTCTHTCTMVVLCAVV